MSGRHVSRARHVPRWLALGSGALIALTIAGCLPLPPSHPPGVQPTYPAPDHALRTGSGVDPVTLAFGPGDAQLRVADSKFRIQTWSVAAQAKIATFSCPNSIELLLSPNGQDAACYGAGMDVWTLVDVASKQITGQISEAWGVWTTVFALDNTMFATDGESPGEILLWDARSGALRATLTEPDGAVPLNAEMTPDGKVLAAVAPGHDIYLWDTASGRVTRTLTDPAGNDSLEKVHGEFQFSADGSTLAAAADNGMTYIWHLATGHRTAVDGTAIAISPDGSLLAMATNDGRVNITDTSRGKVITTFATPDGGPVLCAAFSTDGTELAVGDGSQVVYMWHLPRMPTDRAEGTMST
jgi:WD40 repeat protein